MRVIVYGTPICRTCRRAKKLMKKMQVDYQFVELRKGRLTTADIEVLCCFEEMKAGTLFAEWTQAYQWLDCELTEKSRQEQINACKAYPEMLRCPLIIVEDILMVGYDEQMLKLLLTEDQQKKQQST